MNKIYLKIYRGDLKRRLHSFVLQVKRDKNISTATLALKLEKQEKEINELLNNPDKWTLDTISDLMLAMESELNFQEEKIDDNTFSK